MTSHVTQTFRGKSIELTIGSGLDPRQDQIVFVSITSGGNPGVLNKFVMASLSMDNQYPTVKDLEQGHYIRPRVTVYFLQMSNLPKRILN